MTEQYNDRYLEWGHENMTVNACFGVCGDGACSQLNIQEVEVTFNVSLVGYECSSTTLPDTVYATGSFEGWSGYGVPLVDEDGDLIYSGTKSLLDGAFYEYQYVFGGWDNPTSGADIGASCDWYGQDQYANYGFETSGSSFVLDVFYFGGGCDIYSPYKPDSKNDLQTAVKNNQTRR